MKLPLSRATGLKTAGKKYLNVAALCVVFFAAASINLTGCCLGPRLRISGVQVLDRTDSSVHYKVTVTNDEKRTGLSRLFCKADEADGEVFWQSYMSATHPPESDALPAGGMAVVSQTLPGVRRTLAPGESESGTLNATVAVDPVQHPYLYVDLKSLLGKEQRKNSLCATWNDGRSVRLCDFVPPTAGGACNATFDPAAVDSAALSQYAPAACPPVTAALFANAGPNDVFQFELQADFNVINDPAIDQAHMDQAQSPGTLRYTDPAAGNLVEIPITLEARGKSRYDYCAFRPLKIVFAAHQAGNIFEGASKKIKVVTHCGNHPTNPWILGGTPEEQRRRLLAEYYFYQTLESLGSTALSTRLARITYRNADGSEIVTEYAFLLENDGYACKRCGYVDEAEDYETLTADPASVFQGTLYNKFVYNNDYSIETGHNAVRCKDASNKGYYIPYDWNLTGVIRPEYFKNNNISYTANVQTFWDWLNTQMPDIRTKEQARHIYNHDKDMQRVIANSLLDEEGQNIMKGWYNLYICAVKCFLGQ